MDHAKERLLTLLNLNNSGRSSNLRRGSLRPTEEKGRDSLGAVAIVLCPFTALFPVSIHCLALNLLSRSILSVLETYEDKRGSEACWQLRYSSASRALRSKFRVPTEVVSFKLESGEV